MQARTRALPIPKRDLQLPAGDPAGGGDVRPRRRHVADERLDLRRGRGSRHHGQRRPVGDRARGAGLRRVHPDQQQGRRPHRPQAGLRPGPGRLRDRRPGHDPGPGSDGDHRVLGDRRRAGRVAAAARHAVPDPRQLRGRSPEEGVCPGRGRRRDRRRRRATARRFRHDVPVVAGRVPPRSGHHRGRARQHRPGARCRLHGSPPHRPGRCGAVRRGHGRRRPGHPGLAGGRRSRRSAHRGRRSSGSRRWRTGWCAASARGSRRCSTRTCSASRTSGSGSPSRCCSRSPSAAR